MSSQVSITGRAKTPNLEGYLTFNDFAMIADSTEIPHGSGRINFTGQNFTIDARTYVDKAGYLNVTGLISPQQEFINLSITSNELNLNPAYRLLLALHDVIGFPIGPLDQAMAFGRGEINLDIKGKFDDVSLFGFLNVINATVNYFGLSKPVQNITGRIIFDNDRIVYNGASGFLENSKVTASRVYHFRRFFKH
ncbi:MAG: hypothetical protein MZU97_26790 [Bacillus subtilis]|nr:hypothetical protein [Bacillus subtilis]